MSARDLSASRCVKYSPFSEPFSTGKSRGSTFISTQKTHGKEVCKQELNVTQVLARSHYGSAPCTYLRLPASWILNSDSGCLNVIL